jgi:hypothetical protein
MRGWRDLRSGPSARSFVELRVARALTCIKWGRVRRRDAVLRACVSVKCPNARLTRGISCETRLNDAKPDRPASSKILWFRQLHALVVRH